ncbi:MAG: APC family permease, partial [Acidimicrobiia bacterium]|nr:APC family permease [Acidimicrobiia bacterium]
LHLGQVARGRGEMQRCFAQVILGIRIGFVSQEAGNQGPAIMWVAFLPMFFIAAAYYYMNRADPDCGTTFTWATRALGPRTGWIGGWGIIVADLVIMPSLAGIAGIYTFLLFDANGLANNKWWVLLAGLIFIFLMTLVCVIGIELNARMQFFLLAAEIIVLVIFAVVAFYKIFSGELAGSVDPQLEWLNPFAIDSTSGLVGGLVLAIFLYWGWDTAVTVNEETDHPATTPGRAAIISTLVLIGIYVIVSIAAQGVQGADFLSANADDVLSATGNLVLGSPFDKLLIIAVLTSAAASTQTTILPAARSQLSMSAHKAAPKWFGKVSPKFLTPTNATWFFGFFSMTWYAVLTVLSEDVLGASIAAVGLMISFYYGMTGYACIVYYRKHIFTSVKNFFFVGVAPFLGATSLTYIFVKASIDLKNDTESYGSVGGLGLAFVVGIGLLLIGVPLMLAWWGVAPAFFRRGRDPHPHPAPDGTGAAVPPILDVGPILDEDIDAGEKTEGAITWTSGGNDGR